MLEQDQINRVVGQTVYGSDGDKLGTAKQVFADDETGRPEWVTVATGLFGTKEAFVPLAEASVSGDQLTVPYDKEFVKNAPHADEDEHLTPDQERELYAYYSRTDYATDRRYDADANRGADFDRGRDDDRGADDDRGVEADATAAGRAERRDTASPSTDDAVTVSEERLNVGTQQRESGRAKLRKYVTTENVTQTVPVQREEVRLEREPITDANRGDATSGPAISEEEHEVVLHEERPVVEKEAVPVERVRLDTDTVTEQETVTDEVRKERVDTDVDTDVDRSANR